MGETMQVEAVLARANAAVSQGIRYKLGRGGMNPGSPTPGSDGECDCSGFVAWCLGMSRQTSDLFYVHFNGGWIETSAVWNDVGASTGIFDPATRRAGAVVVYPDANHHEGHIGILIDADHVVHCSKGNDTQFGNAIQITPLTVFNNNPNTRVGWLIGLQQTALGLGPNYRSLVPNGFFSSDPADMSVKRSIRTNNPGALNISNWQRNLPGFVGVTQADGAGNVTAIYVTPEHGAAAWYHLMTDRYGFGEEGSFKLADLAMRYAGVASAAAPAVTGYVRGWRRFSGDQLDKDSVIHLDDDNEVLMLGRAMFGHEIGAASPLHDDQIVKAVQLKRAGQLPAS
jgi:hypothetical protein